MSEGTVPPSNLHHVLLKSPQYRRIPEHLPQIVVGKSVLVLEFCTILRVQKERTSSSQEGVEKQKAEAMRSWWGGGGRESAPPPIEDAAEEVPLEELEAEEARLRQELESAAAESLTACAAALIHVCSRAR